MSPPLATVKAGVASIWFFNEVCMASILVSVLSIILVNFMSIAVILFYRRFSMAFMAFESVTERWDTCDCFRVLFKGESDA